MLLVAKWQQFLHFVIFLLSLPVWQHIC